jgi:transposase
MCRVLAYAATLYRMPLLLVQGGDPTTRIRELPALGRRCTSSRSPSPSRATAKVWRSLWTGCKAPASNLVVIEATGGYETIVASAVAAAHLPLALVNPSQIRDFARADDSREEVLAPQFTGIEEYRLSDKKCHLFWWT